MPMVPAICTQCGAALQVDSAKDAAICSHCGTPFIVEKAINNFNTTVHAGTVIISGKEDFEIRAGVLMKYNGSVTSVAIPDGIRAIGPGAFAGFKYLERVRIPDSVVEIAPNAFAGTTALCSAEMTDAQLKKFWPLFPYARQTRPYYEELAKQRELREQWRKNNLCQYCGGKFSVASIKCKTCGKYKDY